MYILVDKTESEQGNGSTATYYKRLVDYGSRPFVDPNFKWLIACVPVLVVIVLVICLRARKARQKPKFAQEDQVQPESEFVNSPAPDTEISETQLVNQNARRLGSPNRTSGSFGQMLPLWNARSTSLSPICSVPPPAYVRDPPDPPKYEDIIGPDDVPLAHCASRLFRQAELTTHFPNVTVFHQREQIGLTFHLSFVRKTELLPTSVTMALPNLWKIYASFRTPEEERQYSREAFFKFSGYIISCIVMTALASRGLGARQSAQLISSSVRN